MAATGTIWTLEYNGTEQPFAQWGFTDPVSSIASQRGHTFTVRIPGAVGLVKNPPIPYKGQIIVRRQRQAGDAGYSGGEIVFQGKQVTDRRVASQSPADMLTFADAFWDLSRITFQQVWKYKAVMGSAVGTRYYARCNLFQAFAWPYQALHVGAQATEILNYAITEGGVNLQIGAIDPAVYVPAYPVRGIKCLAALEICAKPVADGLMWIDATTTPPTFNWRQRSNLTRKTLPYGGWVDGSGTFQSGAVPLAGAATGHESSDITPRPDLIPDAVVLQYQKTIQDNKKTWVNFYDDVWPAGATGATPQSIVCPLDLAGQSERDVFVTAAAFDPTDLEWWKVKKPELACATITGLKLIADSVTITDESGVTTALPGPLGDLANEYVKGEIMDWMVNESGESVACQHVTISGKFSYDESDAENRKQRSVDEVNGHVISARVRITNSEAGEVAYPQHFDPGELPPVLQVLPPLSTIEPASALWGLARYLWWSLQWLQHEGEHSIVERNGANQAAVTMVWGPQYLLNLEGGADEWATMDATVQCVAIDWFAGRTGITFGPAAHLAPGDLYELLECWRRRRVLDQASQRANGTAGDDNTQIGGATAAENTTAGNPALTLHTVQAPVEGGGGAVTQLAHDATAGEIRMRIVDASEALVEGFAQMSLKLEDLEYA